MASIPERLTALEATVAALAAHIAVPHDVNTRIGALEEALRIQYQATASGSINRDPKSPVFGKDSETRG